MSENIDNQVVAGFGDEWSRFDQTALTSEELDRMFDNYFNTDNKGAGGISAFFLPSNLKGITVGKPEKKMGQQGAHIHDVIFENCGCDVISLTAWVKCSLLLPLPMSRIFTSSPCKGVARLRRKG